MKPDTLEDLAALKAMELALNLSEARNRDLVEHSIYGISRVAADGTFLDANPAFLSILGCTAAEDVNALNLINDVFRFPEQHAELMAAVNRERFTVPRASGGGAMEAWWPCASMSAFSPSLIMPGPSKLSLKT